MILNLLLTDPDNVASGYGYADPKPVLTLLITIIAIITTIIMSTIIFNLYKDKRKEKLWITPTIIMVDIIICIVLILMCYFALQK